MKKIISNIISIILLLFGLTILFLCLYILKDFPDSTVDQLLFSLNTAGGTDSNIIITGLKYIVPHVLISFTCIVIFIISWNDFFSKNFILKITTKKHEFNFSLSVLSNISKIIISLIIALIMIYYGLLKLGFVAYFSLNNISTYLEDNYVDPRSIDIKEPEEKNNLIYIYVESLETSFFSNENGGNFEESVIPNLEDLALNNVSFGSYGTHVGAYTVYGTSWTIAGMIATTAGLPLKLNIDGNHYANNGKVLPGAYSLGEILKDSGYSNYLLIGSDASFGDRDVYFISHGDYTIYDYKYAKEAGWIDEDYSEGWGYEDEKLFEFAQEEILKIADDEPFNFTMLTTNTHSPDGYYEEDCDNPYDEQLLNAYDCTDSQVYEFIKWLEKQDFYEDTTIVITGDHYSMQGNIWDIFDQGLDSYHRGVYNVFINSKVTADSYQRELFSTFDIYPTVLASLGFEIEGNRLGLGTNLFSDEKTLLEKDGYTINDELEKRSTFYNEEILS